MPVDGIALPVLHVHVLHAAQDELQLTLVEVLEPLQGYYLVEALQERLSLLLNATDGEEDGNRILKR